jgi:hypothetical protein
VKIGEKYEDRFRRNGKRYNGFEYLSLGSVVVSLSYEIPVSCLSKA